MKQFIYFVILMICAVLLGSCVNKRPINDKSVDSDTIEQYVPVPTVYEVLEQREELRYALWCDSVYLSMPEQILTHMLVTKGTTIGIMEIVEDYINNKQFYHETILKAMNVQKKYIPDSVPRKTKPDVPLNKQDTISHPVL